MDNLKNLIAGGGPVDKSALKVRLDFLLRTIVDIWRSAPKNVDNGELLRICSTVATCGSAVIHQHRITNVILMNEVENVRARHIGRIVVDCMQETFNKLHSDLSVTILPFRMMKEETAFRECAEKMYSEIMDLYEGRKEFPPIEEMKANHYGRINVYTCEQGHQTVTIDRITGVTPFMIACPACKATGITNEATSAMYRCDQKLQPTHEFFRPTQAEIHEMARTMNNDDYLDELQHLDKGGLSFRKIKEVSNG